MLWQRQWGDPPSILMDLRDQILARESRAPSYPSNNVGGWRTPEDMFVKPSQAAAHLQERARRAVEDAAPGVKLELRAWAVVNRQGTFHRRHAHGSGAVWSGIYYVDPGGEPSARTCFELPTGTVYVAPVAGLMVLFPSNVWHSVEPHQGSGARITIAFDAYRRVP